MIYRGNRNVYKKYLIYRKEVDQVSDKTIANEETWLRHVIEWADENQFQNAHKIRPTFPNYINNIRSGKNKKPLSASYSKKIIRAAYRFFYWLKTHMRGYRAINIYYLDTLKPPKNDEKPKVREYVSLEEIKEISTAPVNSIKEMRIRAAAVFLWLSGMRVSAFATLPLEAVDLEELEIKQWPSLGVRTKNSKYGDTTLLKEPELLEVVKNWDNEIRRVLPLNGLWFSPLLPSTGEFDLSATVDNVGENRGRIVTRNLKIWLRKVGLLYHSPHKFRHGHAFYIKKRAKNFSDLEALKENLMHSSVQITDSLYGLFGKKDIKEQIHGLSNSVEINLLEDIPPGDRKFVLDFYRLYKNNNTK